MLLKQVSSPFRLLIVIALILVFSSAQDVGGFRSTALRLHNYYRQQNNAQPFEMDQELNKMAHAHAEKLASWDNLTASTYGYRENLWSYRGELLPLSKDCEYAIRNWYTGSKVPGRVESSVTPETLSSNSIHFVGFGVGTSEKSGEGYSVVVALYDTGF